MSIANKRSSPVMMMNDEQQSLWRPWWTCIRYGPYRPTGCELLCRVTGSANSGRPRQVEGAGSNRCKPRHVMLASSLFVCRRGLGRLEEGC